VADRLDIVPVGVEYIGAVVGRVIDLAHARRAVVGGARLERRGVERVDRPRFSVANATWTPLCAERLPVAIQKNGRCRSPNPPMPGTGSITSSRPSGASALE
jgi:hypothetical protein